MDLLPTMHSLTDSSPDPNILLDGKSFADQLFTNNNGDTNKDESKRFLPMFCDHILMAVRNGPYKIHFQSHRHATDEEIRWNLHNGVLPGVDWYMSALRCEDSDVNDPPILYNIDHDPGENYPLNLTDFADVYLEIIEKLDEYMKTVRDSRKALLTRQNLSGKVLPCCNPPFCVCFDSLLSSSVCPVK